MGIPVKLEAFEGPLDLLLHLIDKNKVSIYDIPIAEITTQYLDYIQKMQNRDLGIMSEFLVMAATLIDIKSRMLLPKEVDEEGEEKDPRQELVEQLLQYKMYKFMSYELKDRQLGAEKYMYKFPTIPEEVLEYREPIDLQELLSGVTLAKLNLIFKSIMKKQVDRIDPIRSTFGQLEKEDVNLDEKMLFVQEYVETRRKCSFRDLMILQTSKMHIIVTFLAVLELMKIGEINIAQEDIFDDIYITAK